MRYYLGMVECKTHHNERMENIWIRQTLGEEMYKDINQDWCKVILMRSNPVGLPEDIFKRIDIYVEIENPLRATWFSVKYPNARALERI